MAGVEPESKKAITTDIFIATVRKYARARKSTERMLNELNDHIEIHHVEKVDGIHVRKLKIHYSCVKAFKIPDPLPLPEPDVLLKIRKGVTASCAEV